MDPETKERLAQQGAITYCRDIHPNIFHMATPLKVSGSPCSNCVQLSAQFQAPVIEWAEGEIERLQGRISDLTEDCKGWIRERGQAEKKLAEARELLSTHYCYIDRNGHAMCHEKCLFRAFFTKENE